MNEPEESVCGSYVRMYFSAALRALQGKSIHGPTDNMKKEEIARLFVQLYQLESQLKLMLLESSILYGSGDGEPIGIMGCWKEQGE